MKRTRLNSMSDKRRKALKGRYVRSTVQASMLVKTGVLDCTKYLKGSAAGRVGRHDEHKPEGQGEGKGRAEKARKANRARLRMRSGCAAPESKTLPAIATGKRVINPARRIKSINRIGSHWKRKPAVIEYHDKRQRCNPGTVEGRREYFNRKMEAWNRQELEWLKSLGRAPILTGSAGKLGNDLKFGRNSTGGRFAAIPAFTTDGDSKGQTRRQCSKEYKIEVIGKVMRRDVLGLQPGRTAPKGVTVHQYIGISLDEAGRAQRLQKIPSPKYVHRHFPLVEKFITRANCETWLATRVPHLVPRSACVFCPYHSDAEWLRVQSHPQDWARAVEIDEALRTPGAVVNRDMKQTMYLHRSCQPLVQIEFKPATNSRELQGNINFAPECLGVCGV